MPVQTRCTSGVGVLTFETVGRLPRNYSGRVMTHAVAIANAATIGLGTQVLLQPPLLQLTAETVAGVSTQPLRNWMLLLRFDLSFLQVWPIVV